MSDSRARLGCLVMIALLGVLGVCLTWMDREWDGGVKHAVLMIFLSLVLLFAVAVRALDQWLTRRSELRRGFEVLPKRSEDGATDNHEPR